MAQQINGGTIRYGIEYQVNSEGLKKVQKDLRSLMNLETSQVPNPLGKSMEVVDKELKTAQKDAQKLMDILNRSTNNNLGGFNITKFNQELKKVDLAAMRQNLSKVGATGKSAFDSMINQSLAFSKTVKTNNGLLDTMAKSIMTSARIGISTAIFQGFTSTITNAISYVEKLDSSLNDIRIVTKKSSDEMANFAVQANAAAQKLGISTRDYAQGALTYYQQGLEGEDVQKRSEITAKVANVTNQSLSQSAEQVTAISNAFRLSAEEIEPAMDKVARVAAVSASDFAEVSSAFQKVAATASTTGTSVGSLAAQLGTVIDVTREAPETVGTAFKTIYARIADLKIGEEDEFGVTLGDVSGQLAKVGVNILDANGQLKDMDDIITDLGTHWQAWGREQQQAVAIAVAGKRQYVQLEALLNNWDKYQNILHEVNNAQGELQAQQDIYMDRAQAHIQQMNTAWESVQGELLDSDSIKIYADVMRDIANTIASIIKSLGGGKAIFPLITGILTQLMSKQLSQGIVGLTNGIKAQFEVAKNRKAQAEIAGQLSNIGTGEDASDYDKQVAKLRSIQAKNLAKPGLLSEEQSKQLGELSQVYLESLKELNEKEEDRRDAIARYNASVKEEGEMINTAPGELTDEERQKIVKKLKEQQEFLTNLANEEISFENKLSDEVIAKRINELAGDKNEDERFLEISGVAARVQDMKELFGENSIEYQTAVQNLEELQEKEKEIYNLSQQLGQNFITLGEEQVNQIEKINEELDSILTNRSDISDEMRQEIEEIQKQLDFDIQSHFTDEEGQTYNLIDEEKAQEIAEAVEKAKDKLYELGLSEQEVTRLIGELGNEADESFKDIQGTVDETREAIEGIGEEIEKVDVVDTFVTAGSAFMNISMSVDQARQAIQSLTDDSLTAQEKISKLFTTFIALSPMFISGIQQLRGVYTNFTKSITTSASQRLLEQAVLKKNEAALYRERLARLQNAAATATGAEKSRLNTAALVAEIQAHEAETAAITAESQATESLIAVQTAVNVVLLAITAAVIAGATAWNVYQDNLRQQRESAEREIEKLNQSIDESTQKYKELQQSSSEIEIQFQKEREAMSKAVVGSEQWNIARSNLIELQKQMIELYGEEAEKIDLVSGSIEDNINAIEEQEKKKSEAFLAEQERLKSQREQQQRAALGAIGKAAPTIIQSDAGDIMNWGIAGADLMIANDSDEAQRQVGISAAYTTIKKFAKKHDNTGLFVSTKTGAGEVIKIDAQKMSLEETFNELVDFYETYDKETERLQKVLEKDENNLAAMAELGKLQSVSQALEKYFEDNNLGSIIEDVKNREDINLEVIQAVLTAGEGENNYTELLKNHEKSLKEMAEDGAITVGEIIKYNQEIQKSKQSLIDGLSSSLSGANREAAKEKIETDLLIGNKALQDLLTVGANSANWKDQKITIDLLGDFIVDESTAKAILKNSEKMTEEQFSAYLSRLGGKISNLVDRYHRKYPAVSSELLRLQVGDIIDTDAKKLFEQTAQEVIAEFNFLQEVEQRANKEMTEVGKEYFGFADTKNNPFNGAIRNAADWAKGLQKLKKNLDICNKAATEQNETGEISESTYSDLISANEEYAKAIDVVNNKMTVHLDKLKELNNIDVSTLIKIAENTYSVGTVAENVYGEIKADASRLDIQNVMTTTGTYLNFSENWRRQSGQKEDESKLEYAAREQKAYRAYLVTRLLREALTEEERKDIANRTQVATQQIEEIEETINKVNQAALEYQNKDITGEGKGKKESNKSLINTKYPNPFKDTIDFYEGEAKNAEKRYKQITENFSEAIAANDLKTARELGQKRIEAYKALQEVEKRNLGYFQGVQATARNNLISRGVSANKIDTIGASAAAQKKIESNQERIDSIREGADGRDLTRAENDTIANLTLENKILEANAESYDEVTSNIENINNAQSENLKLLNDMKDIWSQIDSQISKAYKEAAEVAENTDFDYIVHFDVETESFDNLKLTDEQKKKFLSVFNEIDTDSLNYDNIIKSLVNGIVNGEDIDLAQLGFDAEAQERLKALADETGISLIDWLLHALPSELQDNVATLSAKLKNIQNLDENTPEEVREEAQKEYDSARGASEKETQELELKKFEERQKEYEDEIALEESKLALLDETDYENRTKNYDKRLDSLRSQYQINQETIKYLQDLIANTDDPEEKKKYQEQLNEALNKELDLSKQILDIEKEKVEEAKKLYDARVEGYNAAREVLENYLDSSTKGLEEEIDAEEREIAIKEHNLALLEDEIDLQQKEIDKTKEQIEKQKKLLDKRKELLQALLKEYQERWALEDRDRERQEQRENRAEKVAERAKTMVAASQGDLEALSRVEDLDEEIEEIDKELLESLIQDVRDAITNGIEKAIEAIENQEKALDDSLEKQQEALDALNDKLDPLREEIEAMQKALEFGPKWALQLEQWKIDDFKKSDDFQKALFSLLANGFAAIGGQSVSAEDLMQFTAQANRETNNPEIIQKNADLINAIKKGGAIDQKTFQSAVQKINEGTPSLVYDENGNIVKDEEGNPVIGRKDGNNIGNFDASQFYTIGSNSSSTSLTPISLDGYLKTSSNYTSTKATDTNNLAYSPEKTKRVRTYNRKGKKIDDKWMTQSDWEEHLKEQSNFRFKSAAGVVSGIPAADLTETYHDALEEGAKKFADNTIMSQMWRNADTTQTAPKEEEPVTTDSLVEAFQPEEFNKNLMDMVETLKGQYDIVSSIKNSLDTISAIEPRLEISVGNMLNVEGDMTKEVTDSAFRIAGTALDSITAMGKALSRKGVV